ncbi:MAG: hypothetical protein AUG51_07290 [Acidobacteria bacterium 13_1_20CM_3_53_8]|nr:MAG: hypothetical protein AUG51_07290 [Acidobacteria bacterium 13_1_20CM_3_53_8]
MQPLSGLTRKILPMLAPDTILQNRYRIIRQLGSGGMGTVYEARALRLNTTVALKETHFTDERLRKQFEREAQLLASLRHTALPRVIDHFDEGSGLFLVMDFIAGEDLWEMLERRGRAFEQDEVLDWADQLLDALDYLHRQEPPVVHRDIKPHNLKFSERNRIVLLDFGLAKGFAGQLSRVTTSASVFGFTPNYAPLEQIQGTGTDPRSDLYSLGATLYHLLTNNAPPDVITRIAATTEGNPDPLRDAHELNPEVSPEVSAVLKRAMEVARNRRFERAAEMREALREAGKQLAPSVNKAKAETLPPTVVHPAPTEVLSASAPRPTIASPHAARSEEPSVTIAAAEKFPAPAADAAPPFLPMPLAPTPQPARKSKALWWIGALLVALLIGVALVVALYKFAGRSGSKRVASGLKVTELATSIIARHPVVSPDGKYVVYETATASKGPWSLWISETATLKKSQLLPPLEPKYDFVSSYNQVTFSPDSKYIYYYSFTPEGGRGREIGIYRIPVTGGQAQTVTLFDTAGATVGDSQFSLSPDGSRIAFYRDADIAHGELVVVNANGTEEHVLLRKPSFSRGTTIRTIAWVPGSEQISFIENSSSGGTSTTELRVVDQDGTNEHKLFSPQSAELSGYVWSPNGRSLLLIYGLFPAELKIAKADDWSESPLTSQNLYFTGSSKLPPRAAWVPDGSGLLIQGEIGATEIFLVRYPGGEVRRITTGDLRYYQGVSMTADSSTLVAIEGESNSTTQNLILISSFK